VKPNSSILFNQLRSLDTEQRNPHTTDIDVASPLKIVQLINAEDKTVAYSVEKKLPEIAKAVDITAHALANNGRLIYIGSGTSGRIGIVDASECPPTFGTNPETVQGLIAGGEAAMFRAQEGAEDLEENGANDVLKMNLSNRDVVCGIAASGRTPYVLGGLKKAIELGAKTIFICCVPAHQLRLNCNPDTIIDVSVGPEVIMGSTRMKSATAQKMVCNMISTGAMIRLGKIYENVMVDLQLTNRKLEERARNIVMMFSGVTYDESDFLLEQSNGHVKTALIMALTGLNHTKATELLENHNGFIKPALKSLST